LSERIASAIEKRLRVTDKISAVLEDRAMSGVFINDQLRVGNPVRQINRVDGGHHDVVIPVDHQCRELQTSDVLRCLFSPMP
jgi:hypothetical protein